MIIIKYLCILALDKTVNNIVEHTSNTRQDKHFTKILYQASIYYTIGQDMLSQLYGFPPCSKNHFWDYFGREFMLILSDSLFNNVFHLGRIIAVLFPG